MYKDITLALLKPHILKHPLAVKDIKNIIVNNGLTIVKSKHILFTQELSAKFYNEHKNKFFYNRLVTFMASGLSEACILTGTNVIFKWRELLGPTKFYKAIYSQPECIRSFYGLSDTRNVAHGSDSVESALREINIIFPEYSKNELETLVIATKDY